MFFANCYALYAKIQLIIPATIIATYSRVYNKYILRLYFMSFISLLCSSSVVSVFLTYDVLLFPVKL